MYIFKKINKQAGLPALTRLREQAGMSYVELIVVLSIFSLLSGVVIYNYGKFQSKVDIKNLAGDIALKIVEAQKSSLSGLLPVVVVSSDWKPSYGVHFDIANPDEFIYFVDSDNSGSYEGGAEELDTFLIPKNNVIDELNVFSSGSTGSLTDLTIIFSRPSSSAVITSSSSLNEPFEYVQIIVTSPNGLSAQVKVYPSGRIQLDSATTSPQIPSGGGEVDGRGVGDGGDEGGESLGGGGDEKGGEGEGETKQ